MLRKDLDQPGNTQTLLDVQDLVPGSYLLQVRVDGISVRFMVIVE